MSNMLCTSFSRNILPTLKPKAADIHFSEFAVTRKPDKKHFAEARDQADVRAKHYAQFLRDEIHQSRPWFYVRAHNEAEAGRRCQCLYSE